MGAPVLKPPRKPPTDKKVEQAVCNAMDCLPQTMKQEHVEALIMTIAQAYAPTTRHAVLAILNAAITLQDYANTLEEAENATQH
jgi:hypothetical protein